MTELTQKDLDALKGYDTPTVCNALEIVAPERRAIGFTVRSMHCLRPEKEPIVGYARTATIRSMSPHTGPDVKNIRADYYDYVENGGPAPAITVIQDLDDIPGFGAFWGEVNTNIHKALGCLGCVTNGSMRDLPDCAEGFQLLAAEIVPSHAHVNITSFRTQVHVCGMVVSDGDLIHADQHGAVVVPQDVARDIPGAADLISRREAVILKACKEKGFGIARLKEAMGDSADIH
jgi:regulator of RNase E activity RraA